MNQNPEISYIFCGIFYLIFIVTIQMSQNRSKEQIFR